MLFLIIQHLFVVIPAAAALGAVINRLFIRPRRRTPNETSLPQTQGIVIRWPRIYDRLIMVLFTRGGEQVLRRMIADRVSLEPGEAVLDVGCGTGTQALEICKRVGAAVCVHGIDPSGQMIVYARRKAARLGLSVDFQLGVIEQLAFPDRSFDVVLCTWMIYHVPEASRRQGLAEIIRVLKPGGRLLIVDSNTDELPLQEAGFLQMETGEIPFGQGFSFTLARKSLATGEDVAQQQETSLVEKPSQENPFARFDTSHL